MRPEKGSKAPGATEQPAPNTDTANSPTKSAGPIKAVNIFALDDAFEDASSVFAPALVPSAQGSDCIIVIDNNALLLPYRLRTDQLSSLQEKYKELKAAGRLFIPARVAREFISTRDNRLTEILQDLSVDVSLETKAAKPLPPHLRNIPGHDEFVEAGAALAAARKCYVASVSALRNAVESWRGNDPVTSAYYELFDSDNIVEPDGDRSELEKEWEVRLRDKRPPGYKDGNKPDTGIGDFLIWKVILKLGGIHSKDLIFVTGEEKPDWVIRHDNRGIYPRPELIAEYRLVSGGGSIRISTLATLLEEMNVEGGVVADVKILEQEASAEFRVASSLYATGNIISTSHHSEVSFDYSTNNGCLPIRTLSGYFELNFTKGSNTTIYVYKNAYAKRLARIKNLNPHQLVDLDKYDSTSDSYSIGLKEYFAMEIWGGATLLCRIDEISDDSRGADRDLVVVSYKAFPPGAKIQAF